VDPLPSLASSGGSVATHRCANGHEMGESDLFCATCGEEREVNLIQVVDQYRQQSSRASKSSHPARAAIVALTFLAAAILLLVIVTNTSSGPSSTSSSQTVSYKDGYLCGADIVNGTNRSGCGYPLPGDTSESAADVSCSLAVAGNGDDETQYRQGCIDGVRDTIYQNAHPEA
jgi:hypothetical protein